MRVIARVTDIYLYTRHYASSFSRSSLRYHIAITPTEWLDDFGRTNRNRRDNHESGNWRIISTQIKRGDAHPLCERSVPDKQRGQISFTWLGDSSSPTSPRVKLTHPTEEKETERRGGGALVPSQAPDYHPADTTIPEIPPGRRASRAQNQHRQAQPVAVHGCESAGA